MSDALFSTVDLVGEPRSGFRLHEVELFNWGTFDKRVWRLRPGGQTALLTGDIGSGKSTLVDAVTTLLLPANRISYNKAAGADAKERTLRSYVEGHYKSERVEATGASRPIGLRDHNSYSVVLGVFVNEGYDETITLAQVFHQRDRTGQPDRFFVVAEKALSIEGDLTDFGSDLGSLRKRLRAGGAEIHTSFPDYSRAARRRLGIASEQAMELLHQTVSMKSVGNLNEFVRSHMLEPADSSAKVRAIIGHFEDLTKAHDAVKRAREQLEALAPLVATADRYDAAVERRRELDRQRAAVSSFFAELRVRLLTAEIEVQQRERDLAQRDVDRVTHQHSLAVQEREELIDARARAGGDRVTHLEQQAASAREELRERQARRAVFDSRTAAAGLDPVTTAQGFDRLVQEVATRADEVATLRDRADGRRIELAGQRNELDRQAEVVRAELSSLAGRTSNLPSSQLDLRSQLCAGLGLQDSDLPFAGELVDVAEEFAEWRGAAERVLRGLALSLLVPDQHYAQVSRWVNERRLTHRRPDGRSTGVRLVYERVPARRIALQASAHDSGLTLADCLEIKEGPFQAFLRNQLVTRADHRCAADLSEFRNHRRAVTREGLVRSGDHHEKDDRSRVDDPRSWVLGWVNERKVVALTDELTALHGQLQAVRDELDALGQQLKDLDGQRDGLASLTTYQTWSELDWEESQARAEAAEAERARLIAGSSHLAEIERRLQENTTLAEALATQLKELERSVHVLDERIERSTRERSGDEGFLSGLPAPELELARASFPQLDRRLGRDLPERSDQCRPASDALVADLDRRIEKIGRELGGYVTSLVQDMNGVLNRWTELRSEMDANVEARGDFRALHDRVARDDLPRFEADFKTQLNTNTISDLAGFNAWLNRQAGEIQSRVDRINEAMGAIDYNPDRYIRLEKERTPNQEIQAFRQDLRNVTNDALAPGDDPFSEQRYLEVHRIVERFRGRDNHADADRAWTRRVTDVRNWFTFSASERDRHTDEEWEHYRDSDGKSGGQKEKLAYTILAASLAYQFGLEWGAQRSRDFRFAVIDEAFGRGSDVSTRYALELFAKLGLQLLIVTPLQKVHVIEPYVRAIGFVDNPSGKYSRLQTLTIEEFHELRESHT